MENAFEVLKERGFIEQMTHPEEIEQLFKNEKITFYIGFDPTADSLHVGHFLTVMAMSHMQRCGHRPICLMGGGTGMVGDPTGKTDMRRMMTVDEIDHNVNCFKKQLSRFIDFSDDKAIIVNNGDWLRNLNYIEFLREIGSVFSVNKMLTAECFKTRMEKGLSFLEFNYMIMQSYDFLELNKRYGCVMQLGGNDQWSNILGGVDLIRRKENKPAYGMTFQLLTNSEGKKMGKTEKGAVWLDPEKTSPYEFYQYWRNVDDSDVLKCIKMLTFLPLDEIEKMESWEGSQLNRAKEILAFELTQMVHGAEEARKAQEAARALFGSGANSENMPTTEITAADLTDGAINILDLMQKAGLIASKGEGRRLVQQGGVSVDDVKVTDIAKTCTAADFEKGHVIIKKGKKVFHKVVLK